MDATPSNAWNDMAKAELTVNRSGATSGVTFIWEHTLQPNSVTLLELSKR